MTHEPLTIDVLPTGELRFLWDDRLASLTSVGTATVRRVSDVEPDAAGAWWADLVRIGGPRLGPFTLRAEAIGAEVAWLRANGY